MIGSEKKDTWNEVQRVASYVIIGLGCIYILWFFFHMAYAAITGSEYDFWGDESVVRLIIGVILAVAGYAMLKLIDADYKRPRVKDGRL